MLLKETNDLSFTRRLVAIFLVSNFFFGLKQVGEGDHGFKALSIVGTVLQLFKLLSIEYLCSIYSICHIEWKIVSIY